MENFKNDNYFAGIEFENEKVQPILDSISEIFKTKQKNDFDLICKLIELRNTQGDYENSEKLIVFQTKRSYTGYSYFELIKKYFGLERKTVEKLLLIGNKFIEWTGAGPKYKVQLFNLLTWSKIYELTTLSVEEITIMINLCDLTIHSTFKEIREFVKQFKNGQNDADKVLEEEINEEEIPLAYDPKQKYEFAYFEKQTKSQLLNIVWELQKFAHKGLK